ncbi:hypothetical protein JCM18918_1204 [Cutibacterium acnes JCM 18918]|nr:hypothetical protein JCM18918_1204 [Cutibacterium acnes JCM 18918]
MLVLVKEILIRPLFPRLTRPESLDLALRRSFSSVRVINAASTLSTKSSTSMAR